MNVLDGIKIAFLMLVVSLVQISFVTPASLFGGHADLVLVTLVSVALLRGPLVGSVAGFWAGLVLDVGTMQPPGLTSFVLTLTGYWVGRFGDATSRSSPHPPYIATALATIWVAVGSTLLPFMLRQSVPAGELFGHVLLPSLVMNMIIVWPVYRLVARLLPVDRRAPREALVV